MSKDGDFGPMTQSAVKSAQAALGITADGIAGPVTQERLVMRAVANIVLVGIPPGLGRSLVEGESGYKVGAVNWSVPGGVDCGVMQRRVLGPAYSLDLLKEAFAPGPAIRKSLDELGARAEVFMRSPGVTRLPVPARPEYALRLAVLAHNWPWAAGQLADDNALSTTRDATWATYVEGGVVKRVKFPDGEPVMTYRDWAEFYALGGRHGPARMTKYVKEWPS